MIDFPIVVTHRASAWTIRFRGRFYDSFPQKEDALNTAVRWADNASRQGHHVTILLHEMGQVHTFVPDENRNKSSAGDSSATRASDVT
jgi:hypothetical protein